MLIRVMAMAMMGGVIRITDYGCACDSARRRFKEAKPKPDRAAVTAA